MLYAVSEMLTYMQATLCILILCIGTINRTFTAV